MTARIPIDSDASGDRGAFAQGPDGSVFFARASTVYVVRGDNAPAVVLHDPGAQVLAVAADTGSLFVATATSVTQYNQSTGRALRAWPVKSTGVPTQAGLFLVGDVLWLWTDAPGESRGLVPAEIGLIHTGSPTVTLITDAAYPADMDADASGLYFETLRNGLGQDGNYLAHATPAGSVKYSAKLPALDAQLTLVDGRPLVEGCCTSDSSPPGTEASFDPDTLQLVSETPMASGYTIRAATRAGLIGVPQPFMQCNAPGCPDGSVELITEPGAVAHDTVTVPYAYFPIPGPDIVVVTQDNGDRSIVRLS